MQTYSCSRAPDAPLRAQICDNLVPAESAHRPRVQGANRTRGKTDRRATLRETRKEVAFHGTGQPPPAFDDRAVGSKRCSACPTGAPKRKVRLAGDFTITVGTPDVNEDLCTAGDLNFTGGTVDVGASESFKADGSFP